LNVLDAFSHAITAVNSTSASPVKCCRSFSKKASSTSCPVIVMRSAYSSASRSTSLNSGLVA
jgi:hypothetical protein